MNFEQALSFVYSRRKFAKSGSLERIEALLKKLGEPQKKLKIIHVLGTNGKGSVSSFLSSVLSSSGHKTGLFTSPFVSSFCERIQIDGEYIPKEAFCALTEIVKELCESSFSSENQPTFFEFVFAVSLVWFAESGCEFAVLEAGIGGRDDSTNVIDPPLVTVFTSISLDHMAVLGDTVQKIAENKCGAIKKGSVVVSFPRETGGFDFCPQSEEACLVLERVCKEKGCSLVFPEMKKVKKLFENASETKLSVGGRVLSLRLPGEHQIANAATGLSALLELQKLGVRLEDEAIESGFEKTFLPGRMEIVSRKPFVLLDGGHNEGAARALEKYILEFLNGKKITALMGYMKDKDYKTALSVLAPRFERIVFTLADEKRGEEPKALENAASPFCKNIFSEEDRRTAFEKAKALTGEDEALVVCGSFYLVGEIRKNFLR